MLVLRGAKPSMRSVTRKTISSTLKYVSPTGDIWKYRSQTIISFTTSLKILHLTSPYNLAAIMWKGLKSRSLLTLAPLVLNPSSWWDANDVCRQTNGMRIRGPNRYPKHTNTSTALRPWPSLHSQLPAEGTPHRQEPWEHIMSWPKPQSTGIKYEKSQIGEGFPPFQVLHIVRNDSSKLISSFQSQSVLPLSQESCPVVPLDKARHMSHSSRETCTTAASGALKEFSVLSMLVPQVQALVLQAPDDFTHIHLQSH